MNALLEIKYQHLLLIMTKYVSVRINIEFFIPIFDPPIKNSMTYITIEPYFDVQPVVDDADFHGAPCATIHCCHF